MGLFNWLLKSAPGSPGSTAKVIVKFYKSLPKPERDQSGLIDKNYGFAEIVEVRKFGERYLGTESWLGKYDTQKLIEYADGQMTILVFCLLYLESERLRESMSSADMLKSSVRVIASVIQEMLPERREIKSEQWNIDTAMWFIQVANKHNLECRMLEYRMKHKLD